MGQHAPFYGDAVRDGWESITDAPLQTSSEHASDLKRTVHAATVALCGCPTLELARQHKFIRTKLQDQRWGQINPGRVAPQRQLMAPVQNRSFVSPPAQSPLVR